MRTIKFRGKTMSGEWVYGSLAQWEDGTCEILHNENENETLVKTTVQADTVGQFTGLFDKNGEEVYEGDVLAWGDIEHEVVYNGGSFGYYLRYNRDLIADYIAWAGNKNFNFYIKNSDSRCGIVGNIHDGKNLL